jgi:hypothetical protein
MTFDLGEPWNFDIRGIWQLTEGQRSNLEKAQEGWLKLVLWIVRVLAIQIDKPNKKRKPKIEE